jgi:hypothetical protein
MATYRTIYIDEIESYPETTKVIYDSDVVDVSGSMVVLKNNLNKVEITRTIIAPLDVPDESAYLVEEELTPLDATELYLNPAKCIISLNP